MQQAELTFSITTISIEYGHTMPVLPHISVDESVGFSGRDLQRHTLIAIVKGFNGLGRQELEQNGVSGIYPSKQPAKNT